MLIFDLPVPIISDTGSALKLVVAMWHMNKGQCNLESKYFGNGVNQTLASPHLGSPKAMFVIPLNYRLELVIIIDSEDDEEKGGRLT